MYIPLTNRVRGPYWKLQKLRFMAQARSARAIASTDRENEVSKIFIMSLLCV